METLSQSAQDYLEAIYLLVLEEGIARVKDVAKRLEVKKPSVVVAVRSLVEKGLVSHQRYGYLELTSRGMAIAKEVYERHQTLFGFFHHILGVEAKTAERDACLVEHYISTETQRRLVKFIEFVEKFPTQEEEPKWLINFRNYLETGGAPPCITQKGGEKVDQKGLNELRVGERGIVRSVKGDHTLRKRLMDMGMVPGTEVVIERVAPLGDPVDVEIMGYHLSLRKEEARNILVEVD